MSTVLLLQKICKKYPNGDMFQTVLENVTLKVEEGTLTGIIGPNGSGKTTLLKIAAGLLPPDEGWVNLFGLNPYSRGSQGEIREKVGFMFQEDLLIPTLSLKENIELPLIINGVPQNQRTRRVEDSLKQVAITHLSERKPNKVSGGERRRASLARSLVNNPKMLFLDEPTSSMDTESSERMMKIIKKLNNKGTTVLLCTHDQYIVNQIKNILQIRDGKIEKGRFQT